MAVIMAGAFLHSSCDRSVLVQGTARILNGATAPATVSKALPSRLAASKSTVPEDGVWILSPDQVRITIVQVSLWGGPGSKTMHRAELTECTVTYDRSAPSLSSRLDCPFEVAVGSYYSVSINYELTHQVLIDDPVNSFYTDPDSPTGLSTTPPADGAQFVDYTIDYPDRFQVSFPSYYDPPLEVTEGSELTVDIVLHGLHTGMAEVTAGEISSGWGGKVVVTVSAGGAGKSAYYAEEEVTTAGSYREGAIAFAGGIGPSTTQIVVLYDHVRPIWIETLSFGGGEGCSPYLPWASPTLPNPTLNHTGGSVGLDSKGTLCWVSQHGEGPGYDYGGGGTLFSMPELDTPGAMTNLSCQDFVVVPAPVGGESYASGCPQIEPEWQTAMRLIAN